MLASTETFLKCPEGLVLAGTSNHRRGLDARYASSCAIREVNALGTASSSEQQPREHQEVTGTPIVVRGTGFQRDPAAGGVQANGEAGVLGAHPPPPKPHGAALTWADGLQKLVLRLGGLLDFKTKI